MLYFENMIPILSCQIMVIIWFFITTKRIIQTQQRNLFSRDSLLGVKIIKASSIESYGRVIHKKTTILIIGRHHIDKRNMSFYTDLGLDTIYEIARISGMPLQEVARSTPGRAVASLEIIEALKTGTCIPYKKQKPENEKKL